MGTLRSHSGIDFLGTCNLLGLKSILFHEKGTNDYANNARISRIFHNIVVLDLGSSQHLRTERN